MNLKLKVEFKNYEDDKEFAYVGYILIFILKTKTDI